MTFDNSTANFDDWRIFIGEYEVEFVDNVDKHQKEFELVKQI